MEHTLLSIILMTLGIATLINNLRMNKFENIVVPVVAALLSDKVEELKIKSKPKKNGKRN